MLSPVRIHRTSLRIGKLLDPMSSMPSFRDLSVVILFGIPTQMVRGERIGDVLSANLEER